MEQIKFMMTETQSETADICRRALAQMNVDFTVVEPDGLKAYGEMARIRPNAVLLDIFMPGLDALAIKRRYEREVCSHTAFFAIKPFESEIMELALANEGFLSTLTRPLKEESLALCMRSALERLFHSNISSREDKALAVTAILHELGMPAHMKGFRHIRNAILLAIDEPSYLQGVTTRLYPDLARISGVHVACVERSMRNAIETCWDRGCPEAQEKYFLGSVSGERGKPTNSEFIALIADWLRLKTL